MLTSLDFWIIVTAALTAMACTLPGTFLLLSKQSMMSHGIAHAVLPGIVLAHLAREAVEPVINRSIDTPFLLLGAVVAGIACALLTRLLQSLSGIESGAALGISFTTLFALGLVLQRLFADHVHIEPSHVLWGNLEMAVFTRESPPPATIRAFFLLLLNLIFVVVFFKELTVATFDPNQGNSTHTHPRFFYYALITLSAITCVIAFESVGSILVVAMMIVPPASAFLLSKNLKHVLAIALILAIVSSLIGHLLSIAPLGQLLAGILQIETDSQATNSAAGIALTAGLIFIACIFLKKFFIHSQRAKHAQTKNF